MAYTAPTPQTLQLRYPAFAGVDDAVIQYWLDDAVRSVDESWAEGDFQPARMALAAHMMAMQGLGASEGAALRLPAGVTRFRSGAMDVQVSDSVAIAATKGGYEATRYGQEYLQILRRNKGGPTVITSPIVPTDYYGYDPYYAGPLA